MNSPSSNVAKTPQSGDGSDAVQMEPHEHEEPTGNQRSQALDLLRAAAVLLVLGRHLDFGGCQFGGLVRKGLEAWYRGGWVGVDLFFVLSGFLISGLLFREHQKYGLISFKRFFIRRGFKIYPPFYLLLLLTWGVKWFNTGRLERRGLIVEALFVQNYFVGWWSHTWSLAVEEHFYLLLPAVLIVLAWANSARRYQFKLVPWIFVGLALFCLGLRLAISHRHPYTFGTHQAPTHLRIDSLFFGVVLSYFYHYHPAWLPRFRPYRLLLLFLGVSMILPAFVYPVETTFFLHTTGLTLLYAGFGLILIAMLAGPVYRQRPVSWISYVGSRSYSIYLWHLPLAFWGVATVKQFFGGFGNWWFYAGFYLGGASRSESSCPN
jgi:peptidoglycan/LPS O-acetylase OafA/YrhL